MRVRYFGLFVAISIVLFSQTSQAQYNNAFFAFWNYNQMSFPFSTTARDIVDADPGYQCVLGIQTHLPAVAGFDPNDYFISLKKIDVNGNPIWDHSYLFSDTFYKLEPWRLIKTDDEGFIIVGRAYHKSVNPVLPVLANPFAFKVDMNGGVQWANLYLSNFYTSYDSVHTAIARVADDSSSENYMIVRSGSSVGHQTNDVLINALKIDVGGNLIWNKKYYQSSPPPEDSVLRDFPKTITYVHDSSGQYYFIAGTNNNINRASDVALFYLGIDKNGTIVRNYHWQHVPTIPYGEDAIFDDDPSEQSIVLSYTYGNSPLVDPSKFYNHSQVGIMKLDGNLNIKMRKYYWSPHAADNQCVRIKRNVLNDAYVVACNVKDSGYKSFANMAMLKVQKNGTPIFYNRYNIYNDARAYSNLGIDDQAGSELYGMVGDRKSYNPANTDLKTLATDANGLTCGVRSMYVLDSDYVDSVYTRGYSNVDTDLYFPIMLYDLNPDQILVSCDSSNANTFRQIKYGSTYASGVSIYPTVLTHNGDEVTIDFGGGDHNSNILLQLTSFDGRKLASRTIDQSVVLHQTSVKWKLPNLPVGLYLLTVQDARGKSVFKLVQQ